MAGAVRHALSRLLPYGAYGLVVGMSAIGFFRLQAVQHDQCEALDRFAINLGAAFGASDDQVQEFIDQLHHDLESC